MGRSPWLPLETTLDTSDTTQETTRRQLKVKCYRSTYYAKGTTIVAIAQVELCGGEPKEGIALTPRLIQGLPASQG